MRHITPMAIASTIALLPIPAIAQTPNPPSVQSEAFPTDAADADFATAAATLGMTENEMLYEASKELEASTLPRKEIASENELFYEYDLGEQGRLTFPASQTFENRISSGFENGQIWVELTPLEQKMAAAGGLGGVAAAVCLAGPVACVVGGVIAGAIGVYVSERGVCPNEQRMVLYFRTDGRLSWGRCGNK